jgi:lipopolysaccharide export system protein LptA
LLAVLLVFTGAAAAQGNLEGAGYRELSVISSDEMEFSFATGQIEYITQANLILIADNKADNLPIKANRVTLQYADEETTVPSRILLEGNVEIDHPEGRITAANVDMNFETEQATFTGNPVIYNPKFPDGFFGDEITLDLKEQKVRVKGARAPKVILSAADPADRLELQDTDVSDWTAFLASLKAQIAADAPSPGKHIGSLLEPVVRGAVLSNDVATLLEQQNSIRKLLNGLLENPGFYNAAAWEGYTVSAEVKQRLSTPLDQLDRATLLWANRSLLHTAFPGTVAAPPTPADQ